ncbi:MAG TPA: hypothetical protein VKV95_14435 [Terriglobia bacterium]|nr:hypothetical protein [Terriglobia bacterium]
MRDAYNDDCIKVNTDGDYGPYLVVDPSQVAEVRAVLDNAMIRYTLDSHAISLNGRPAITVLNLGNGVDVDEVQRVLDAAD